MQQDNFRNLNRAIFTHRKHLESRVSVFSYCFPIIKQNTFHYLSLFSRKRRKRKTPNTGTFHAVNFMSKICVGISLSPTIYQFVKLLD